MTESRVNQLRNHLRDYGQGNEEAFRKVSDHLSGLISFAKKRSSQANLAHPNRPQIEEIFEMTESTELFTTRFAFTPETLERHSKRTKWCGAGLIILGIAAILLPGVFTLGFEILLSFLLIIGGVSQIAYSLGFSGRKEGFLPLIAGLLSVILGVLFLINPFEGAAVLTFLLAGLFLLNGILRVIQGFQFRDLPGAGWGTFSGVAGIIIAILVWSAWPTSAGWFIGVLLGIDFLILGFFLLGLASAARREARS